MKLSLILSVLLFTTGAIAADFPEETAEAQALARSTQIADSFRYCTRGTLTCRTLVMLKDKQTGKKVRHFYDVFASSERAVGGTGYFIRNEDGTFHSFLDSVFNGAIAIDTSYEENRGLRITYDWLGFPTIHNFVIKRLGTTRYAVVKMSYHFHVVTIVGNEYDTADPNYRMPASATYERLF